MNLGTLEFSTRINNQAVKDAEQIKQEILAKLQNLDVRINIRPQNLDDLKRQIEDSIRNGNYRINLQVDNSTINNLDRIYTLVADLKSAFEDAAKAAQQLGKATSGIRTGADSANDSLFRIHGSMRSGINISSRYASGIATLFNVYAAKQFLSNIIEIGGQLEKQRVSMGAILGDVTKANVLFDQIKSLAIKSPFGVVELDQYTKQLAAYGFEYNELYDMVKRLADISAGAGQDIGRLTLALGHVKSQTYLTGITMRQFSMNNIPMLKMLAEYYSELEGRVVKVAEVQKRISQRQVSYEDVIEQIKRLTDAGGMFYNMQEKISDTLAAKWKNLRDAFSIMYGEMAESTVGDTLKDIATTLTRMTKHWKEILSVLASAVSVWGSYVILSKSWLALNVVGNLLKYGAALKTMTNLTRAQTIAQAALNTVTKINPYIAVASAVVGLIALFASLREKTLSVEEATQKYNESIEKQNALMDENQKKAEMWAKILTNVSKAEKERNDAYNELLKIYPNIFTDMDQEIAKNLTLEEVLKRVNKERKQAGAAQTAANFADAEKNLKLAEKEYQDALSKFNKKKNFNEENKDFITGADVTRQNQLEQELRKAEKILETRRNEYDIAKKLNDTENKRQDLIDNNKTEKWFQDATEAAKKYASLKPEEDKTWEDYFDKIEKRRSELQGKIDKLNPKAEGAKDQLAIYNQEKEVVDYIYKTILGGQDKQSVINKQESAELKAQRDELNRLKEEYSEYKKLKKDIGKVSALDKIQELFPNKIDGKTENEFIENYKAALQRIVDVTKDENLKTQITKLIFDVDQDVAKDSADRALALINEEIEKKSGQFNLYKSIFEKTGKRDLATLAFSDGQIWDEQATVFANKLSKLVGKTNIDFTMSDYDAQEQFKGVQGAYELWKKIVNLVSNNYKNALEKSADAISDVMSIEEQIQLKESQIQELRDRTDGFDYSPQIEQMEQEVVKLKGELLSISPEFQALFKDTTDMSIRQISKLYEQTKEYISLIRNNTTKEYRPNGKLLGYFFKDGNDVEKYIPIDKFRDLEKQLKKLKRETPKLTISFQRLWKFISGKDEDGDGKSDWSFQDIAQDLAEVAKEAASSAKALGEMFDSFGKDDMADALELSGELLNSVGDISKGIAEGNPFAVVNGIAGAITSINKFHDKKLDKSIQKSALEVKKLENAYKNLQYEVSKQLTKISKEQSATLLKNLEMQRSELQKQQELESQKKKKDKDKIIDYQQQVEELGHEIADFYEELASDRYDINIDSWADKISDAITNAFASGEDAAKAFNDTVADIMQDVVSNIVKIGVVKPAMDKLQEYLFGANGIATTSSEEGVEISANEAMGLVAQLSGLRDTIGQAQDIWNVINDAARQAGVDMAKAGSSSEGTLSKGVQGMSENTADLLSSYLNSIRADVASIRLLQEGSGTNPIAQAQLQNLQTLVSLAQERNTRIGEIYDILSRARTDKAFGIYVK